MKKRSKLYNEFGEDLSLKKREIIERCVVASITVIAIAVVGFAAIRNERARTANRTAPVEQKTKVVRRVAEVVKGLEFLADKDNGAAAASFTRAIELDRKNVEALVGRGVATARQGDLVVAESDFLAAVQLNPMSASIYANLGFVRAQKKDLRGAIENFSRALDLDSNLISVYGNRAYCYFQKGEYSLALDDISHVVRLDKRNAPAYYNRAILLGIMNRFDTAVANLSHPCLQDVKSLESRKLAAFFQSQSGNALDSLKNCRLGLEQSPKDKDYMVLSIAALKLIADSEPSSEIQTAWEQARDGIELESIAIAQSNLQKLASTFQLEGACNPRLLMLEEGTSLPIPTSEKVAAQNVQEALEYLQVGDLETAVACFRESLRNVPYSKETVFKMALTLVDQGRNAMAADELSKLAKRFPDDSKILVVQSMVCSRLGKFPDAIGALDRAISLSQNDAALFLHRANVRMLSGQDFEKAIEDCRRAERLGTVTPELLDIKARALSKLGDFEAAIVAHNNAIEITPNDVSLLLNRSETYRLNKQWELARADAEKTVSLEADEKSYHDLALCQFELADYEKALESIEAALKKRPKVLKSVSLKGQILAKQSKYREAIDALKPLEPKATSSGYHETLAFCHLQLKEYEDAWKYIAKTIDKGDQSLDSLSIAAQVTHALGEHNKAKSFVERFVKAGGSSPEIDFLLGKYASDRKDWRGSIDHFKSSLKKKQQFPEAWQAAGYAFEQIGELGRAKQCYSNAIKVGGNGPDVRMARAKILVSAASYSEAMADLNWLKDNNVDDSRIAQLIDVCNAKTVNVRKRR